MSNMQRDMHNGAVVTYFSEAKVGITNVNHENEICIMDAPAGGSAIVCSRDIRFFVQTRANARKRNDNMLMAVRSRLRD